MRVATSAVLLAVLGVACATQESTVPPGFAFERSDDTKAGVDSVCSVDMFESEPLLTGDEVEEVEILGYTDIHGKDIKFDKAGPDDVQIQGVCEDGRNPYNTAYAKHCALRQYYNDNGQRRVSHCSAYIWSRRHVITNAHCIWTRSRDGTRNLKAYRHEVWCGRRTVDRAREVPDAVSRGVSYAPQAYFDILSPGFTNRFDMGIVEFERNLPYSGSPFSCLRTDVRSVEQTGYSGVGRNCPACAAVGFDGKKQFSSRGTVSYNSGAYFGNYDSCPGSSGGGIWDASMSNILCVNSGGSCNDCTNHAVRSACSTEVRRDCSAANGGVSPLCMERRL